MCIRDRNMIEQLRQTRTLFKNIIKNSDLLSSSLERFTELNKMQAWKTSRKLDVSSSKQATSLSKFFGLNLSYNRVKTVQGKSAGRKLSSRNLELFQKLTNSSKEAIETSYCAQKPLTSSVVKENETNKQDEIREEETKRERVNGYLSSWLDEKKRVLTDLEHEIQRFDHQEQKTDGAIVYPEGLLDSSRSSINTEGEEVYMGTTFPYDDFIRDEMLRAFEDPVYKESDLMDRVVNYRMRSSNFDTKRVFMEPKRKLFEEADVTQRLMELSPSMSSEQPATNDASDDWPIERMIRELKGPREAPKVIRSRQSCRSLKGIRLLDLKTWAICWRALSLKIR
eukprot:TRINITY_DN441_c0_g1_i5.p1 TRINITY_DN441_c0_g1~~TRINITY_DN441_c0_g1_i5.p1  ORF type:complete len:339 (-),score=42.73 TRINITY_DN441_c0_g1_i5:177-1193(-)